MPYFCQSVNHTKVNRHAKVQKLRHLLPERHLNKELRAVWIARKLATRQETDRLQQLCAATNTDSPRDEPCRFAALM